MTSEDKAMATRKRYLGNSNTQEVHDLDNEKTQCNLKDIKPEHKVYFSTLQAALNAGYNRCGHCLE